MSTWAIETHNLQKIFRPPRSLRRPFRQPKPVTAVNGVDLLVRPGELFGLLGPNGAGKTTLIKMLCTLIVPTAGTAQVMGLDLNQEAAIKHAVGLVVSDERSFYWRLSARQNLDFFAAMGGLSGATARQRIDEVLAAVELDQLADRRFSNFSSGMRQRLAIARSLLHRPKVLFLDEPTRSLDPNATGRLHKLIRTLVQQEKVTIMLTTHNLHEAEGLCDRIAVMHQGQLRACAPPDQLRRQLPAGGGERYRLLLDRWPPELNQQLALLVIHPEVKPAGEGRWQLGFQLPNQVEALTAVLDTLRSAQVTIHHIQSELPSLEDVFVHYTRESTP